MVLMMSGWLLPGRAAAEDTTTGVTGPGVQWAYTPENNSYF